MTDVFFDSLRNTDLSFVDSVKLPDAVESIRFRISPRMRTNDPVKLNFKNRNKVKMLVLDGSMSEKLESLIGMPYFEEFSVFEQACQSRVKDQLSKYFTKKNGVYIVKKEFLDSDGTLNPDKAGEKREDSTLSEIEQSRRILYIALKLDAQSKIKLEKLVTARFGEEYGRIYCDHLTLAYGEDQVQAFDMDLIGERVQLEIWNIIYDAKAVAAQVDLD